MNDKKNNKNKNLSFYLNKLKEMAKDPKGKAILFFVFYFFFFLILIISIRVKSEFSRVDKESPTEEEKYSFTSIVNGNYHYNYNILLNNDIYTYDVDKINSKEKFSYTLNNENMKNYYRNNDLFLTQLNNEWQKTENPYILKEFLNIDMIKTILDSSTYSSKTEYESGNIIYHYEISTSTLLKLLENVNIDLSDETNKVDIVSNEDNIVDEIDYNIDSYIKYKNINNSKCSIKIKYSKFGEISKIEEP